MSTVKKISLTGDRPSGKLHLGHYVGSLKNRVIMQDEYRSFVMLADLQALTDNYDCPQRVREAVFEICLDYLAVGIDPVKTTIFIQSQVHAIFELTKLYLNLVTVARLSRNPTVKDEIKSKGFEESLTAGFLVYPVSQAADITCVGAEVVPVGEDQIPMIEQCNEIIDRFNAIYGPILKRCKAVVPEVGGRLMGVDGKQKMSKSLGNAIFLSDEEAVVRDKVMKMFTDPHHVRATDPGRIEGNVVFAYLDVFATDVHEVARLKEHYQRGGLGDIVVKKYLTDVLLAFLKPIRERRLQFAQDPNVVWSILKQGCAQANEVANKTLALVREAVKINYF